MMQRNDPNKVNGANHGAGYGARLRPIFWLALAILVGGAVGAWPDKYAALGWTIAAAAWLAYGRTSRMLGLVLCDTLLLAARHAALLRATAPSPTAPPTATPTDATKVGE